jgi:starch synthase
MISAAASIQGERVSQPVGGSTSLVDLNTVRPVSDHNPNRKKVLFVTSEMPIW